MVGVPPTPSVCEVCGEEATWASGTPEKAAKGYLYRQRFLCATHAMGWGSSMEDRRAIIFGGGKLNYRKWQEAFTAYVEQAKAFTAFVEEATP